MSMLEYEDGPSRRVSRRLHGSGRFNSHGSNAESTNTSSKCESKRGNQSGWFSNSFNTGSATSNTGSATSNKRRRTSLARETTPRPLSSTPKSARLLRRLSGSPSLNTSDALLADIDLESIQADSQQSRAQQTSSGEPVQQVSSSRETVKDPQDNQPLCTRSDRINSDVLVVNSGKVVGLSPNDSCLVGAVPDSRLCSPETINDMESSISDTLESRFTGQSKFGNYQPTLTLCSPDVASDIEASLSDTLQFTGQSKFRNYQPTLTLCSPDVASDIEASLSDTLQFTGKSKFGNYHPTQPTEKNSSTSDNTDSESIKRRCSQHRCTPFSSSCIDSNTACDNSSGDMTFSALRDCTNNLPQTANCGSVSQSRTATKHSGKCLQNSSTQNRTEARNESKELIGNVTNSNRPMSGAFSAGRNVCREISGNAKLDCKRLNDSFSITQLKVVDGSSQVCSCSQWNNKDLTSSTQIVPHTELSTNKHKSQLGTNKLKSEQNASDDKQKLVTQTGSVCITQCTLPEDCKTQTQSFTQHSIDTTLLKDGGDVKYRCTPFTKGSQSYSQSESQRSDVSKCRNITLSQVSLSDYRDKLKNKNQAPTQNPPGRCSTRSQYFDTQTVQNSFSVNPMQTQFRPTQCLDTQPRASNVCDMTGVIVDSQDQNDPGNDSSCDLFGDSFHDPDLLSQIQELDEKFSQSQTQQGEITSHTQRLVCREASARLQTNEVRKDLIDDCSVRKNSVKGEVKSQTRQVRELCVPNMSLVDKGDKSNCSVKSADVSLNSKDCDLLASRPIQTGSKDCDLLTSRHIQTGAIQFGSKEKDGAADGVQMGTSLPITPIGGGSLQQRIMNRLKQNVGQKTPDRPALLMEQLRERALAQAQLEAASLPEGPEDGTGSFYGLPSKVKTLLHTHRGISNLYDWQDECLKLEAIANRKNLIYSLPTSGGKTLVAEILILREILCAKRDAMLILPFVSIVQEKVRDISQFAVDLNFHVEEYAGSRGRFPPLKRRKNRSLYIATIEKAHAIINSLIEGDRMDNLGLVVVDELHMIGERGSRGAKLESTLMKILHAARGCHIIGMSATLNNIDDLKCFLNAEVYSSDFRPVKLTEHIKLSDNIYKVDSSARCEEDRFLHDRIVCFQYLPEMEKADPDHLLGLALEVIPDNSCLIFCATKKNCENVAQMLCKLMDEYKSELSSVRKLERRVLLKELRNDSDGNMCPVLKYTIKYGVAYHHSGLTTDERRLIEDAYSAGTLCLLTCTSTLAAGVNLPAKRVILRSPYIGCEFLCRSKYKQMVGRAGRAGIDSSGESILICKTSDRERICELLGGPLENCHSSLLYDEGKGIRSLLLSTIGLKMTSDAKAVFRFMSGSLLKLQETGLDVDVTAACRDALQALIDQGLVIQTKNETDDNPVQTKDEADDNHVQTKNESSIQMKNESDDNPILEKNNSDDSPVLRLHITVLGLATFKGSVDPDIACRLYKDLREAEESLVISTYLHLLYLVTPYDMSVEPSWFIYHTQMNSLTASESKVAQLIGVPEDYIGRKASQQRCRQKVDQSVIQRFYLTLMLYDLWKHKSIWEVADKFKQPRGFLQSLLSSAASFASCVSHFCDEMSEFWAYRDLMGNFVKQLSYCVTAELIPLMEISGIKLGRARLMYAAGYQSLSSVANADPEDLVKSIKYLPRKVARQIVASAKLLLNEKAAVMMEQMDELVSVQEVSVPVTMAMVTTSAPLTQGLSQSSADSEIV